MATRSLLEVRLFGRPTFAFAAVPYAFSGPPRALPLLAYLATSPGVPVLRETLAVMLWPDADEATARANLRRHVHLVVKALPPTTAAEPWIVTTATMLTWNPDTLHEIDVATFERLSASNEPSALEAAVGRYGGDYLDGYDDEWVAERRGRFATQQLTNLERLIARAIAANDVPRALVYAQMMLAADPWREDAIRHVVRLKNAVGDRAGALAAYERFSRQLRDDIGVDPMPETMEEYRRVVRGAEAAPLVVEEPPAEAAFVGREIERATLDTAISRLKRGHGGAILIGGEAGIGKTALTEVFEQRAEAEGVRVVRAATAPHETMPYEGPAAILADIVDLLGDVPIEPVWLAALAPLVPALDRRGVSLPELAPLNGERDRRRLFDAAIRVIEALAARTPLAIVLEDVHWSGAASIAFLVALVEEIAEKRVLVLVTYRDEEIERGHPFRDARRRLAAAAHVQRMVLGPLGRPEIERLIAPVVAASDRATFAARLAERTDGNAFFLSEIVRNHGESGERADALPASLRETIFARLERLSDGARGVAEFGAIVGRAFDVDLVREIAGWSEHDVVLALDELMDRRIVRDLGASTCYAFVHQLIPETIVRSMDGAVASRRHRRVAVALEELAGSDLDGVALELARHYECGGEPARAASYYLRGAQLAAGLFAHDDAIVFATNALALTNDDSLRCELLFLRESAARNGGDRDRQRADLAELGALPLDEHRAFEVTRRAFALAHVVNDRAAETQALATLTERACRIGTDEALAAADVAEGLSAKVATDYARAIDKLESARRRFLAIGDISGVLQCVESLMVIAQSQARFDVVDEMLREADRIEEVDGRAETSVRIGLIRCLGSYARSDWSSTIRYAEQTLMAAKRSGDSHAHAEALFHRGVAETWRFEVRAAREDLHEAARLMERLGDRVVLARIFGALCNLEMKTGRFAAAMSAARRFVELSCAIGHAFGEAAGYINLSYAASLAGEFDRAADAARRAVDMLPDISSPRLHVEARANLAIAERGRGAYARAVALLEDAVELARARGVVVDLVGTLAQLSESYRCIGRLSDARRIAEEVVRLANDVEADVVHPQLLFWYASKAFAIADPARSLALAHRAYDAMRLRAAAIPDNESQANYLALSYNREVLDRLAISGTPAMTSSH